MCFNLIHFLFMSCLMCILFKVIYTIFFSTTSNTNSPPREEEPRSDSVVTEGSNITADVNTTANSHDTSIEEIEDEPIHGDSTLSGITSLEYSPTPLQNLNLSNANDESFDERSISININSEIPEELSVNEYSSISLENPHESSIHTNISEELSAKLDDDNTSPEESNANKDESIINTNISAELSAKLDEDNTSPEESNANKDESIINTNISEKLSAKLDEDNTSPEESNANNDENVINTNISVEIKEKPSENTEQSNADEEDYEKNFVSKNTSSSSSPKPDSRTRSSFIRQQSQNRSRESSPKYSENLRRQSFTKKSCNWREANPNENRFQCLSNLEDSGEENIDVRIPTADQTNSPPKSLLKKGKKIFETQDDGFTLVKTQKRSNQEDDLPLLPDQKFKRESNKLPVATGTSHYVPKETGWKNKTIPPYKTGLHRPSKFQEKKIDFPKTQESIVTTRPITGARFRSKESYSQILQNQANDGNNDKLPPINIESRPGPSRIPKRQTEDFKLPAIETTQNAASETSPSRIPRRKTEDIKLPAIETTQNAASETSPSRIPRRKTEDIKLPAIETTQNAASETSHSRIPKRRTEDFKLRAIETTQNAAGRIPKTQTEDVKCPDIRTSQNTASGKNYDQTRRKDDTLTAVDPDENAAPGKSYAQTLKSQKENVTLAPIVTSRPAASGTSHGETENITPNPVGTGRHVASGTRRGQTENVTPSYTGSGLYVPLDQSSVQFNNFFSVPPSQDRQIQIPSQQQSQILSPPCVVEWEQHQNFRQQGQFPPSPLQQQSDFHTSSSQQFLQTSPSQFPFGQGYRRTRSLDQALLSPQWYSPQIRNLDHQGEFPQSHFHIQQQQFQTSPSQLPFPPERYRRTQSLEGAAVVTEWSSPETQVDYVSPTIIPTIWSNISRRNNQFEHQFQPNLFRVQEDVDPQQASCSDNSSEANRNNFNPEEPNDDEDDTFN